MGPAEDEVGEGRALKAARLCSRLGRLISADLGSTIHVPSPAASGCEVSCREQCGVRVLRQITETLALFKPRCGPHIPFMPHQNQSKSGKSTFGIAKSSDGGGSVIGCGVSR